MRDRLTSRDARLPTVGVCSSRSVTRPCHARGTDALDESANRTVAARSSYAIPATGFGLQNRGGLFSLDPSHPNALAPGKRPFHTIIPGFVTQHGHPLMSFGVMGGSMQAQGHTQVMTRMVDHKQNPQAASDAPRWRVDAANRVGFEPGIPPETIEGLRARGHEMNQADRWSTDFGRAQLIYKLDDGYCGASERRTDGQAGGF